MWYHAWHYGIFRKKKVKKKDFYVQSENKKKIIKLKNPDWENQIHVKKWKVIALHTREYKKKINVSGSCQMISET